jgi:5-methylcytosine-specific restriction protein A
MTRKQFIQSKGATCKNWNWSWSFINNAERFIIFGAWDRDTNGRTARIFSEDWRVNPKGQKSKGYSQSREHIRLIEEEGYRLMTFPMHASKDSWKDGRVPKIESFTKEIAEKALLKIGVNWFATDPNAPISLAEELTTPEKYPEGARTSVTINAYERNPKARAACIAYHGCHCAVCGFNFVSRYGGLGKDFIHVHHIKPLRAIAEEYEVDPKKDLIPVCPNCHAMIHRTEPCLSISELREHLKAVSPIVSARGGGVVESYGELNP